MRRLAFGDSPGPVYTGQFIWRASAPRPPDVDEYFMHVGPVSKVGLYPVSGDRLYLFLLQASPLEPTRPEGDLRALLRSELEPFGGHVAEIAQRLDPGVDFRGLKSVIVPAPWHRGRVLLIGDAAHATTPHIGYGLGIAVEDAIVLAELAGSGEGIAEILDVFTLRRFGRCRLVVENSRQLGEWEQNPPDDPSVYGALMGQTLSALAQPI